MEDWGPTFTAKVDKAWKIWLPKAVRECLDVKKGDYVEVKIKLARRSVAGRGELK